MWYISRSLFLSLSLSLWLRTLILLFMNDYGTKTEFQKRIFQLKTADIGHVNKLSNLIAYKIGTNIYKAYYVNHEQVKLSPKHAPLAKGGRTKSPLLIFQNRKCNNSQRGKSTSISLIKRYKSMIHRISQQLLKSPQFSSPNSRTIWDLCEYYSQQKQTLFLSQKESIIRHESFDHQLFLQAKKMKSLSVVRIIRFN